jgi:hypothetical protein
VLTKSVVMLSATKMMDCKTPAWRHVVSHIKQLHFVSDRPLQSHDRCLYELQV